MKVILTRGDGTLALSDVQEPVIGPYDCRVKLHACLFCNSTDRHIVDNSFPFGIPYPAILGHESIGTITDVGASVRNFAPGDCVVRPYAIYFDEVVVGVGSGWGGFAEIGKIRDHAAMVSDGVLAADAVPGFFAYMQKLPPGLALDCAMLISCQKEIYSSTRRIEAPAGRSFLVLGAGVAGILFAMFLKRAGAAMVTLAARRQSQVEPAAALSGADRGVTLDRLDRTPFDALVDTTGGADTVRTRIADSLAPDGTFYSYAVYPEMVAPGFFESLAQGRRFVRIDPSEASVHDEVCQLLLDGALDPDPFITHRFGIDDALAAWQTVIGRQGIKTAIVF